MHWDVLLLISDHPWNIVHIVALKGQVVVGSYFAILILGFPSIGQHLFEYINRFAMELGYSITNSDLFRHEHRQSKLAPMQAKVFESLISFDCFVKVSHLLKYVPFGFEHEEYQNQGFFLHVSTLGILNGKVLKDAHNYFTRLYRGLFVQTLYVPHINVSDQTPATFLILGPLLLPHLLLHLALQVSPQTKQLGHLNYGLRRNCLDSLLEDFTEILEGNFGRISDFLPESILVHVRWGCFGYLAISSQMGRLNIMDHLLVCQHCCSPSSQSLIFLHIRHFFNRKVVWLSLAQFLRGSNRKERSLRVNSWNSQRVSRMRIVLFLLISSPLLRPIC